MNANLVFGLAKHCLHLCNSQNFEETLMFHLLENGADANVLVTSNVSKWNEFFEKKGLFVDVRTPEEPNNWKDRNIVVDNSSLSSDFTKWEQHWEMLPQAVCIYNIDGIDPAILRELVAIHDKMVLSVNNIRMLSSRKAENELENINAELVEGAVKRELNSVVLAMLMTNPMCGSDLIKALYLKFRVFVSPGQLYPKLHELEKDGLLVCEYKLKSKIYRVSEKEQAWVVLKKQAEANSLIMRLLTGN
ncbi:PadR family transcriptional regulator [Candidatus Woesearchaeota archaeon]|nr:PadR family transcriptional regulator [Candidatus Woesearchaeota archaeon]